MVVVALVVELVVKIDWKSGGFGAQADTAIAAVATAAAKSELSQNLADRVDRPGQPGSLRRDDKRPFDQDGMFGHGVEQLIVASRRRG